MKPTPFFEDAINIDQLIYQLAAYDVSNGLIFIPKDMDEVFELQKNIAKRFNNFKRLIQDGEMTYEELNKMVALRCGPFSFPERKMSMEKIVDEVTNVSLKEPNRNEISESDARLALAQLFGEILGMAGNNNNLKIVSLPNSTLEKLEELKRKDSQGTSKNTKPYKGKKKDNNEKHDGKNQ